MKDLPSVAEVPSVVRLSVFEPSMWEISSVATGCVGTWNDISGNFCVSLLSVPSPKSVWVLSVPRSPKEMPILPEGAIVSSELAFVDCVLISPGKILILCWFQYWISCCPACLLLKRANQVRLNICSLSRALILIVLILCTLFESKGKHVHRKWCVLT